MIVLRVYGIYQIGFTHSLKSKRVRAGEP